MPSLHCHVCGKTEKILKLCTRCEQVFYCSRSCQAEDWPSHRHNCTKMAAPLDVPPTADPQSPQGNSDKNIWDDTEALKPQHRPKTRTLYMYANGKNRTEGSFTTRIDFAGAAKRLADKNKAVNEKSEEPKNLKTYLNNNEVCDDVPCVSKTKATVKVTVKANRNKYTIELQEDWSGEDILKYFAHNLQIPLDKLKVIHKGKVMTADAIKTSVKDRALFQAIGERAESEDGLSSADIDVIMKQLSIDRNVAVKALKQTGDVVDAIFHISNK